MKLIKLFSMTLFSVLAIMLTAKAETSLPIGKIEQIEINERRYFIIGYVCQQGFNEALAVHIYMDGLDGGKPVQVAHGKGLYKAEDSINTLCQSHAGKFKFKIEIPKATFQNYAGKKIYAYGINLIPGSINPQLENSGKIRVPTSTGTTLTPGCMSSAETRESQVERSAYSTGFMRPQNGEWTYIAWVWRNSYLVETNHSVSIMRSRNLKNWYNLCGEPISLPVTVDSKVVVDPTLTGGGILNAIKLGFDQTNNPVITYQKYQSSYTTTLPASITTQVYNARSNGNTFIIQKMTDFTTKHDLSGGGALSTSADAINYSGINYYDGKLVQFIKKASIDQTGTPVTGTWILNDLDGTLSFSTKGAPAPTDPFYRALPGTPDGAGPLEARAISGGNLGFFRKKIAPRFDDEWVLIRGDWEAEGFNRPALFDRKTRTFVIRQKDQDKKFSFGPSTFPLRPLVGDWDGDQKDTIGVELSDSTKYFKNALEGGIADKAPISPVIKDGQSKWHTLAPTSLYRMTFEALTSNRDSAYDCNYRPLLTAESKDTLGCPGNFLSNLTLYEYSEKTGWVQSIVDKMWAGSEANIDFLVFKNLLILAYYDRDRKVTIAIRSRTIGSKWNIRSLDSVFTGWDAHNSLVLNVDENHDIHLLATSTPPL